MSNLWDRTKEKRLNRIDYARDINARSIYPNNFNAGTMISLHTNASPNPAVHGLSIYFENRTGEGEKIAKSIICYMKEQLIKTKAYPSFRFNETPKIDTGEHAEVASTRAKNVLIELGFHTNRQDAALLQNKDFQQRSMLGVEKGYRLYLGGERECKPFSFKDANDVVIPMNTVGKVTVHYDGFPVFPVVATMRIKHCTPTPSSQCGYDEPIFDSVDHQIDYKISCNCPNGSTAHTFSTAYTVTLRDADDVITDEKDVTVTCKL